MARADTSAGVPAPQVATVPTTAPAMTSIDPIVPRTFHFAFSSAASLASRSMRVWALVMLSCCDRTVTSLFCVWLATDAL